MKSKETKEIIRGLANKYGISMQQVQEIVNSPFLFVANTMRSGNRETGEFKSVFLSHFGTFAVKPGRIKFFEEYMKKQKKKEEDDEESTIV